MDCQTSACLYGSAATGHWVAGRSDLDLLVLVPQEKLDLLGQKITEWLSIPGYPFLDGFVLFSSGSGAMAKRIDKFDEPARAVDKSIELVDLWNIKNRSKHLFGIDLKTCVREIRQDELRNWTVKNIERFWIPLMSEGLSFGDASPEPTIPLSKVVWTASGVARTLMLAKGNNCSSKREALLWLADECPEIRETINLLGEEFEKPDSASRIFSGRETHELGRVYLRLLRQVRP